MTRKRILAAILTCILAATVAACVPGKAVTSQRPPGASGSSGASATAEASAAAEPSAAPAPLTDDTSLPRRSGGGLPLAGKVAPPETGAYFGAFAPDAPWSRSAIDDFEKQAGKPAAIVMWYQAWGPDGGKEFVEAAVYAMMKRGKVPMITWEPWNPGHGVNQPDYSLAALASGKYDAYYREWARKLKALGGPVMIRLMHEMNGTWYPWGGTVNGNTPEQYVAAWRHMHDIFTREGATNVTWVWSINHHSVPASAENTYAAFYPGSEYVDWVSISGFNFGRVRSYSHWQEFPLIYDDPIAYLKTLGKPICVSEFGCVEKGGDKAAWIKDAYRRIQAEPAIDAVLWFDFADKRASGMEDWRIDTTPKSLAAFKQAVAPAYFVGTKPPMLARWLGALTASERQALQKAEPIY
jgi:beta-mannanase